VTLGSAGRNYIKTNIGSSGHVGGTRFGQTRKKPKDLSEREREDRGRGEGGGLYVVYMCERGGGGREEFKEFDRRSISTVIHTVDNVCYESRKRKLQIKTYF
jgi:hypothetical protein